MKKKIFIIDDEPHILEALTFVLRDIAFDVTPSLTGKILFEISSDALPDLIVMDAWLATENGIDITRILKRDKKFEAVPIIIISADAHIEKSALDAGAFSFLLKPFGIGIFLDIVDRALA